MSCLLRGTYVFRRTTTQKHWSEEHRTHRTKLQHTTRYESNDMRNNIFVQIMFANFNISTFAT